MKNGRNTVGQFISKNSGRPKGSRNKATIAIGSLWSRDSNHGGGLHYSNVATNAAILPGRLMRREASMALSYCTCVFNFGFGSRIYSNTNIAKNSLDGEAHESAN